MIDIKIKETTMKSIFLAHEIWNPGKVRMSQIFRYQLFLLFAFVYAFAFFAYHFLGNQDL